MQSTQMGGVDCGLFALAYTTDLAHGNNPSQILYDQSQFRSHLLQCLNDHKAAPFPRIGMHPECSVPHEYTAAVPETQKWSVPKQLSPRVVLSDCTEVFPTQNRFLALSPQAEQVSVDEQPTSSATNTQSTRPQHSQSGNVVNLSNRTLSKSELSLLDMGLSFSPSRKTLDKLKVCEDTFKFIRRLKLAEYFKDNERLVEQSEDDRDVPDWTAGNPDWYPTYVQENRSQGLEQFIRRTVEDIRHVAVDNDSRFWNNLNSDQRRALNNLKADKTIVIKPSDKSGGIVLMDRTQYELKCLEHLTDSSFYEVVPENPNPSYRSSLDDMLDELKGDNLISDVEYETMKNGDRCPVFYGLPKIHKAFDNFPSLRPICSGSEGVTVKLSEFIDSFLGPAARKTKSYVKDTTDFVNKVKNVCLPTSTDPVFLATMDVTSLYTNIDHSEGVEACMKFLDARNNKRFPTNRLCSLIYFILKSNTMRFLDTFYHQIKGTAMGTPMAVNYANLFMSSFENDLLADYSSIHGTQPFLWLRYIDDIFFVWVGSEESLHGFIDFAKQYSATKKFKSNITFTSMHSNQSVQFLDTVVHLEGDRLTTDLFSKPTAAHDFLHRSSYHPQHLLNALPKSQFIRIRRICTHIRDYKRHVQLFIGYFKKRGYREPVLQKLAMSVGESSQESFLSPRPRERTSDRIPFVLDYHHKLQGIPHILRKNHAAMIRDNPSMKEIFPATPIVSYRKQKNLRDHLVRADHRGKAPTPTAPPNTNKTSIRACMNHSGRVTNDQTNTTFSIEGGNGNDKNVIRVLRTPGKPGKPGNLLEFHFVTWKSWKTWNSSWNLLEFDTLKPRGNF